ncbi:MAG: cation transporter [Oscillospiraceae bacterium]|nr:cation transporter [Oscillospiraceae bacterium]
MTKLLLRLFVKNYEDAENPAVHGAVGKLAGVTGIVCNALLFLGKLITGWLAGSLSIMADAVNNLSDAASSVVTLLGFRLAQRPADKDHPYGHARYEYLSGLAVAVLILVIGVELVKSAITKILHPEPAVISAVTVTVLIASVAVKLWMSGFFASLGKRIRSTTLRAASVDSRNDVLATSAVLGSCLIQYFFNVNLDGYVGLAVALFILWSGVNIAKETISPLLGKQADPLLVEKLTEMVLSHNKILGIHDLLVHDYGPGQCFASVHAELDDQEDSVACHDVIDHIERQAYEELNVHLVIHFDPVAVGDAQREEMRETVDEIIHSLDPQLSMHDFRLIRDTGETKLMFDLAVPYGMDSSRERLKQEIDEALRARGKQCTTEIHFDGKE